MQKIILGTSKDATIVYQKLTRKYLNETYLLTRKRIFTNFDVCRTIGVAEDPHALSELDQITSEAAKHGMSLIAVDKNTDKVVGMVINKLLVKSQPFFETFRSTFKTLKSRQVLDFMLATDKMYNVFEHCQINCAMELLYMGTCPEYRRRGIARKLCELSIDLAQNLRDGMNVKESVHEGKLDLEPVPEAVFGIMVTPISHKIGEKIGLEIAVQSTLEKLELSGQIIENPNVQTPISVGYKFLGKKK